MLSSRRRPKKQLFIGRAFSHTQVGRDSRSVGFSISVFALSFCIAILVHDPVDQFEIDLRGCQADLIGLRGNLGERCMPKAFCMDIACCDMLRAG